jgi:hypothetical protein
MLVMISPPDFFQGIKIVVRPTDAYAVREPFGAPLNCFCGPLHLPLATYQCPGFMGNHITVSHLVQTTRSNLGAAVV